LRKWCEAGLQGRGKKCDVFFRLHKLPLGHEIVRKENIRKGKVKENKEERGR
jgi:hypothetical protein